MIALNGKNGKIQINPRTGWSRWWLTGKKGRLIVQEVFVCCDCGLAHDHQFRVLPSGRISQRVRRNEEITQRYRNKHRRRK